MEDKIVLVDIATMENMAIAKRAIEFYIIVEDVGPYWIEMPISKFRELFKNSGLEASLEKKLMRPLE